MDLGEITQKPHRIAKKRSFAQLSLLIQRLPRQFNNQRQHHGVSGRIDARYWRPIDLEGG